VPSAAEVAITFTVVLRRVCVVLTRRVVDFCVAIAEATVDDGARMEVVSVVELVLVMSETPVNVDDAGVSSTVLVTSGCV